MSKYLIKESELRFAISKVVQEELNLINEGLGDKIAGFGGRVLKAIPKALVNVGTTAARTAINPFAEVGKILGGTQKYLNDPKTLATTNAKEYFGFGPGNKATATSTSSNAKSKKIKSEKDKKYYSIGEFGKPETKAINSKKLENKREIYETSFLGGEYTETFGKHYFEQNQTNPNSKYNKKLEKMKEYVNAGSSDLQKKRRIKKCKMVFSRWLDERDKAYEEFIKSINK